MPSNHLSIKSWNKSDRPREKFLEKGPRYLSDSELLSIFLGTGSRNMSAITLAKNILASINNNLYNFKLLNESELMNINGIGKSKAVTLLALVEFSNRFSSAHKHIRISIKSSSDVFNLLKSDLGSLHHEEFWILHLNNSNKIIKKYRLSKGGISSTLVDVRLLLKSAIISGATSIILVHNHPSGNIKPSQEDIYITSKIKIACEKLDLKVLDHVIISEKTYFSFADENIL